MISPAPIAKEERIEILSRREDTFVHGETIINKTEREKAACVYVYYTCICAHIHTHSRY